MLAVHLSAPSGLPSLSTLLPLPKAQLTQAGIALLPRRWLSGLQVTAPQLLYVIPTTMLLMGPRHRLRHGSRVPWPLRGRVAPDRGTQSGGFPGKSLSRSGFQGTWNLSGSAAGHLAMGQGWGSRGQQLEGDMELRAS